MASEETSAQILERFKDGDSRAADELFARYVVRLTLLARSRLSPALASRTDPEDVVLSAYRSFFIRARDGQFQLEQSGDLWRLLVVITQREVSNQIRYEKAVRRALRSPVRAMTRKATSTLAATTYARRTRRRTGIG